MNHDWVCMVLRPNDIHTLVSKRDCANNQFYCHHTRYKIYSLSTSTLTCYTISHSLWRRLKQMQMQPKERSNQVSFTSLSITDILFFSFSLWETVIIEIIFWTQKKGEKKTLDNNWDYVLEKKNNTLDVDPMLHSPSKRLILDWLFANWAHQNRF